MDIVVTKWVALEGTVLLAESQTESLLKKFPQWLVREAKSFVNDLDTRAEEKIARDLHIDKIVKVGSDGIFGALWEIAEECNVGLEADLRKIPVRQETIEIFNFMDLNPYEYASGGMLLLLCDDGANVVIKMRDAGILATVIGKTTNQNARMVKNKERVRYLTPKR